MKFLEKSLQNLATAATFEPTLALMEALVHELLDNLGEAEYDANDLTRLYRGQPDADMYVATAVHGHNYGWMEEWAMKTEGCTGGYNGGYETTEDMLKLGDFFVRYYKLAESYIDFCYGYAWVEM